MRIKCFEMRQLYANKMFQHETIICKQYVSKRDNYVRIKCFKMRHYMQLKCFETRQLYANKMFQNETIKIRIKCFKTRQLYANYNVSKRDN